MLASIFRVIIDRQNSNCQCTRKGLAEYPVAPATETISPFQSIRHGRGDGRRDRSRNRRFVTSLLSSDHAVGLSTLERALSLNLSCATALCLAAAASSFSGRSGPAMDYAKRANSHKSHLVPVTKGLFVKAFSCPSLDRTLLVKTRAIRS
jgi:hypothetical protein